MNKIAINGVLVCMLLLVSIRASGFSFTCNKDARGALSQDFLKELKSVFNPKFFIETGTYSGLTTIEASKCFEHVKTVELSEAIYRNTVKNFSDYNNITAALADSPSFLSDVIPYCNGPILFWLDAHSCGGNTAIKNGNTNDPESITPIKNELIAILKSGRQDITILIDDMRIFGSVIDGTEYVAGWPYPSIQEIKDLCLQINPHFSFALLGDQLLVFDSSLYSPTLSPVVQACTNCRFFDGQNLDLSEQMREESEIMNAGSAERDFIKILYRQTDSYRFALFYYELCYGLVMMGEKNWSEANRIFGTIGTRVQTHSKSNQLINKEIKYWSPHFDSYLRKIESNLIDS